MSELDALADAVQAAIVALVRLHGAILIAAERVDGDAAPGADE